MKSRYLGGIPSYLGANMLGKSELRTLRCVGVVVVVMFMPVLRRILGPRRLVA